MAYRSRADFTERSLPESFCCVFAGRRSFCLVRGRGYPQVRREAEDAGLAAVQAFQQCAAGFLPCFRAWDAADLLQPHERGRAESRRSAAIASSGTASTPSSRAWLAAWMSASPAWPGQPGSSLGAVGEIAQHVRAAQLVRDLAESVVVLVAVVGHGAAGQVREGEPAEGFQRPVAREVAGQQVRAGDQQVPLRRFRPGRPGPASRRRRSRPR